MTNDDDFNVLGELYYDIGKKEWVGEDKYLKDLMECSLLTFFTYSFLYNQDHFEILYTSNDFNSKWMNIKKELFGDRYRDVDEDLVTQKTLSEMSEGKNYITFPVKIKLLEYGDYEI